MLYRSHVSQPFVTVHTCIGLSVLKQIPDKITNPQDLKKNPDFCSETFDSEYWQYNPRTAFISNL
jgi:hypothetical protein